MPRNRGRRIRLDTGIYQDDVGRSIIISIDGKAREFRYPPGTPLEHLRRARESRRGSALAVLSLPAVVGDGTLAADVQTYLGTLPQGTKRRDQAIALAHWVALFGDRSRVTLTTPELGCELARWQDQGVAASTLNKRRQALKAVYQRLDPPNSPNPVVMVPRAREPRPEARAIPIICVDYILAALSDQGYARQGERRLAGSKSKARLSVMATTGLPPAQIKRIERHDVDLKRATVYIRPRLKGRGRPAVTLPLTPAAVEAFQLMAATEAWGPFRTRVLGRAFTRAVKRACVAYSAETGHRWPGPANLRPYDLRHSFLTEAYRQTGDVLAVAELALHADLTTTARYTQAAVSELAAKARDGISFAFRRLPNVAPNVAPKAKGRKVVQFRSKQP